ncbi:MAG: PEP-CTERM sorting domain-containing protein [Deferribacteres bacterium]|nr:PEP-CTERM sorting domain-containing protein [Deferribacteres bacterium]
MGDKINKLLLIAGVFFVAAFFASGQVFGYTIGASYVWNPGTPNYNPSAVLHTGTIDTNLWVAGDFLGRSSTQPYAGGYGDSGISVNWDDTWISWIGDPNTNGDALDGLWAQIFSDGGWWDMGRQTSQVAVFSSQDHAPYLGEGLEYRVFGTNNLWDNTSLSSQAVLTDVYLDGWRTHDPTEDSNGNGWLSDDISAVFQLDGSYRYIKLVAWGGGSYSEPEIDAVGAPVPEPSTFILIGTGLIGLAFFRKRFKQ